MKKYEIKSVKLYDLFRRLLVMSWLGGKNIGLNWRHSLATMTAIMGGYAAVSLFDGFVRELEWQSYDSYVLRGMLGHIVVEKKDAREKMNEDPWGYSLSQQDQDFLFGFIKERQDQVAVVNRFLQLSGMASNGKNSAVFIGIGYDVLQGTAMRGERWRWDVVAGQPLYEADRNSVILGIGLAQFLGCDYDRSANVYAPKGGFLPLERSFSCPKSQVQLAVTTESLQVNALNLKVAGLIDMQLRELNDRYVQAPMEVVQNILDTDKVTRFGILLKDEKLLTSFASELKSAIEQRGLSIDVYPWIEHPVAKVVKSGMEVLGVFRNLFLYVVVLVAIMAVANTMMKSINERIRELATLRSFGFRRFDILTLLSVEGLLIGLFSCLAGLLFTWVVGWLINHSGITYRAGMLSTPMPLAVREAPIVWLTTTLLLTGVSTLTAFGCAWKTSRMGIADALRYVA